MSSESLLKYKAGLCAKMLAESILSDEIKSAIIENIDKATEQDLDKLLESLEKEQLELEKIEKELGEFEKEESGEWENLKIKQEEVAQEMLDEFMSNEMRAKL